MAIILKSVNTCIIALAVFELAMVINQEYRIDKEEYHVINSIRRTLPRFIGTVCVALSLDGLIMVIKYSQLDMIENLYFPVAVIVSTALLFAGLGVLLKLSPEPISIQNNQNMATLTPIDNVKPVNLKQYIPA